MFKSSAKPFRDQNFTALRKECQAAGNLFQDPEFPPNTKTLSYKDDADAEIKWMRPGEICENPKLFVDGASSDDFAQGELGNCWFIAACAGIAEDPELWKKVVPDHKDQEWSDGYAGIFHFQFWRCGEWVDVVIDDFLPTRDGQLVYAHSKSQNEFWSALLEKAYAKLFGDYESLSAGKARDAQVDMMGGIGEEVSLTDLRDDEEKKEKVFDDLVEAFENHSLMSASIQAKKEEVESKLDCGLVKGHAYTITMVKDVRLGEGLVALFKNDRIRMIRCRNPWGGKEWTGPWSDTSDEWKKLSDSDKQEMELVNRDDGEFWMNFDDFCKHFTSLDICHIINTSFFSFQKRWHEDVMAAEWSKPHNCGGCPNHDSHINNPQYIFDVTEEEGDVIISMEQEDQRASKEQGKQNLTMGFSIYKADLNREYRMHDLLDKVHTSTYIDSRSIFQKLKIPQGRYLIIPCTFEPGVEGRFTIRLFGSSNLKTKQLTEDGPTNGGCCGAKYKSATRITLINATGLEKQDLRGGADPYAIIKVEGQEIKVPVVKDTLNPEWNWRTTFYRKKPGKEVRVEIWNKNILKDELLGKILIIGMSTMWNKKGKQDFTMTGEGKYKNAFRPGRVYMEICKIDDVTLA